MHILFASISLPYPPRLGQRMRNWALLRAFHAEGHRVTLISFATSEEMNMDLAELRAVCEAVYLIPSTPRLANEGENYVGRLRALSRLRPYGVWRSTSSEMKRAIRALLEDRSCDAIVCDEIYQLQNLAPTGAPVLLNKDGVVTEIMGRYLALETDRLRQVYGRVERELTLRFERRACSMVSAVLVCSDRDAQSLIRISPHTRVAVVPNVIDTHYYQPARDDDGQTVLFVGAMDWMPNRDAVEFFVRESWPRLRQLVPRVRLLVAGRNPSPEFIRGFARDPEIIFTGTVPDVRPFLEQAAVSIVPLRIGSGTRIKILEAAAMAKPVVSTVLGAEGLDFHDDREIILADAPLDFARAVADLLNDVSKRRTMGSAARRLVVERYSIPVLAPALRKALGTFSQTRWAAGPQPSRAVS